jgi:hypothetical protein
MRTGRGGAATTSARSRRLDQDTGTSAEHDEQVPDAGLAAFRQSRSRTSCRAQLVPNTPICTMRIQPHMTMQNRAERRILHALAEGITYGGVRNPV